MRISNKTPLCLLPAPVSATTSGRNGRHVTIKWEELVGPMPPDAELFLLWIENKDLLIGSSFMCNMKHVPMGYDQLQLNDNLLMQKRIETMAARRTRPLGMAPADDFPQTASGDDLLIPCENENTFPIDEVVVQADANPVIDNINDLEAPFLDEEDNCTDASDNVISGAEDDLPPIINEPKVVSKPVPVSASPPIPVPSINTIPLSSQHTKTTHTHNPEVTNKTADDHNTNEDIPVEPADMNDDAMERQTLLRQLDLLRMKFKSAVIPSSIGPLIFAQC
jgi:hypothetical protein